ncbi:MAG: hypothetical protein LBE86_12660 [Gemmobacter sp.]|jgi:hypothetical protein|nr:hypothetical protein [Gemmobacter sp.]
MQEFPDFQGHRYTDLDFVSHYYYGGRKLALSEIGHLREIAEHYAYAAGGTGVFYRLAGQVADRARIARHGGFTHPF